MGLLRESVKRKMMQGLQGVQVVHYIPGRARLYSRLVHNKPVESRLLADYLAEVKEVKRFTVNYRTGSILIEYLPEEVAANRFLQMIERFIISKYGGGSNS